MRVVKALAASSGPHINMSACCSEVLRLSLKLRTPNCHLETPINTTYQNQSLVKEIFLATTLLTAYFLCHFICQTPYTKPIMGAFEPLPPPRNIHEACRICEQHFLTERSQRANKSREYHRLDDHDAQLLLLSLPRQAKNNPRHVKDVLASHGDMIP